MIKKRQTPKRDKEAMLEYAVGEKDKARAQLLVLRARIIELQKLKPRLIKEFEGVADKPPGFSVDQEIKETVNKIEDLEIKLITDEW